MTCPGRPPIDVRSCPRHGRFLPATPCWRPPGPSATVCADVTHTTENADAELDLRVRAVAGQLTEQGAPESVVEALRKGQVETLVLTDEPGDDTLLVGGSPLELGVRQQDMDALGTHGDVVPADRALLAAAVASSAAVVMVPGVRHA